MLKQDFLYIALMVITAIAGATTTIEPLRFANGIICGACLQAFLSDLMKDGDE